MMRVVRKIVEIDEDLCNGCGECVPACAEAALEIVDGKARVLAEKYCDGLGACLGNCPQGALKIIEREADDFDEKAVEQLLAAQKKKGDRPGGQDHMSPPVGGCPSAGLQTFTPQTPCQAANRPVMTGGGATALLHWPVQIRLVPPTAPFLKNADLLVAADCAPVAYPDFHRDFLQGRAIMMGCPKFDDVEGYVEKFREVFATADIKSVTMVIMEVPCCSQMRGIIAEAMKRAGKDIPVTERVVSVRGETVA